MNGGVSERDRERQRRQEPEREEEETEEVPTGAEDIPPADQSIRKQIEGIEAEERRVTERPETPERDITTDEELEEERIFTPTPGERSDRQFEQMEAIQRQLEDEHPDAAGIDIRGVVDDGFHATVEHNGEFEERFFAFDDPAAREVEERARDRDRAEAQQEFFRDVEHFREEVADEQPGVEVDDVAIHVGAEGVAAEFSVAEDPTFDDATVSDEMLFAELPIFADEQRAVADAEAERAAREIDTQLEGFDVGPGDVEPTQFVTGVEERPGGEMALGADTALVEGFGLTEEAEQRFVAEQVDAEFPGVDIGVDNLVFEESGEVGFTQETEREIAIDEAESEIEARLLGVSFGFEDRVIDPLETAAEEMPAVSVSPLGARVGEPTETQRQARAGVVDFAGLFDPGMWGLVGVAGGRLVEERRETRVEAAGRLLDTDAERLTDDPVGVVADVGEATFAAQWTADFWTGVGETVADEGPGVVEAVREEPVRAGVFAAGSVLAGTAALRGARAARGVSLDRRFLADDRAMAQMPRGRVERPPPRDRVEIAPPRVGADPPRTPAEIRRAERRAAAARERRLVEDLSPDARMGRTTTDPVDLELAGGLAPRPAGGFGSQFQTFTTEPAAATLTTTEAAAAGLVGGALTRRQIAETPTVTGEEVELPGATVDRVSPVTEAVAERQVVAGRRRDRELGELVDVTTGEVVRPGEDMFSIERVTTTPTEAAGALDRDLAAALTGTDEVTAPAERVTTRPVEAVGQMQGVTGVTQQTGLPSFVPVTTTRPTTTFRPPTTFIPRPPPVTPPLFDVGPASVGVDDGRGLDFGFDELDTDAIAPGWVTETFAGLADIDVADREVVDTDVEFGEFGFEFDEEEEEAFADVERLLRF